MLPSRTATAEMAKVTAAMMATAINSYGTTLTNVQNAQTQLNALIEANEATYAWDDISPVLHLLADPDNLEVNGIKAGEIVKHVCTVCGGNGGGKPDSAMGGGKDPMKVDNALAMVDEFVASKVINA